MQNALGVQDSIALGDSVMQINAGIITFLKICKLIYHNISIRKMCNNF